MKQVLLILCALVYGAAFSQSINHLKSNLYMVNPSGNQLLVDGNDVVFDDAYSDSIDDFDVYKMNNFSENYGVLCGNSVMIIETRKKTFAEDTIQYKLWNLAQQQYQFAFTPYNFTTPGLTMFLHDCFLNADIPIDTASATTVNFSVTSDSASFAPCRFYVVLKVATTLSTSFMSIDAASKNNQVALNWEMSQQQGIMRYGIERSFSGKAFVNIGSQRLTGNAASSTSYKWIDAAPATGINYYRIVAYLSSGGVKYSPVAKGIVGSSKNSYTIFPNPVTDGHINIAFNSMVSGKCVFRLVDATGRAFANAQLNHSADKKIERIFLPALIPAGNYYAELISSDNQKVIQPVIVKGK